jgi:hypothetical protein
VNAFVDDRNDSKRAEARVEDFMVEARWLREEEMRSEQDLDFKES